MFPQNYMHNEDFTILRSHSGVLTVAIGIMSGGELKHSSPLNLDARGSLRLSLCYLPFSFSHLRPVYADEHLQWSVPSYLIQIPLFRHDEHDFIKNSQC